MSQQFDVIVIGVGAMGSAACFHLAHRGAKVLGIEQFDLPHDRGSSHGHSRMIRTAYFEHPDYVPLLRRAYFLWDQLESLSGRRLLHRTGGLFAGPGDGMLISGARASAQMHQIQHEMLDPSEVYRRWPQFKIPSDWAALFEHSAGFLEPEDVISTYAELAMRGGAEIHARQRVLSWTADDTHVTVTTDRAVYHADQLAITAGAWSSKTIADLGVPLMVTRQVMGWVWPRRPELFEMGRFPVWGIDSLDGGIYYGFPMHAGVPGLKLAHHLPRESIDPDEPVRAPSVEDEADFRPALTYLPDANGPLVAMRTCKYTMSPDQNFIIDRHPRSQRVHLACGFSGHGFKFSSVVGEILADLALSGSTALPIGFLSLNRLKSIGTQ